MPQDDSHGGSIDARRDRLAPGIPRFYHPAIWFGAANAAALIAIAAALLGLEQVAAWEWLVLPLGFFAANWVEYRVHRGPMHHRSPMWQMLFERHTRQHHVYFDHEHMAAREDREYYWVFFPWWAVGLVMLTAALFAWPISLLSDNAARLFFAAAIAYYLAYEWLHLSYHLPPAGLIGRRRLVRKLRVLHTIHHDPTLMTRHNFNITFPICDRLYGTLHRAPAPDQRRT